MLKLIQNLTNPFIRVLQKSIKNTCKHNSCIKQVILYEKLKKKTTVHLKPVVVNAPQPYAIHIGILRKIFRLQLLHRIRCSFCHASKKSEIFNGIETIYTSLGIQLNFCYIFIMQYTNVCIYCVRCD